MARAEAGDGAPAIEEEPLDSTPLAFVGVRSCDLHAIATQDRVFIGGTHVDRDYAARRDGAFIVAVNCFDPSGRRVVTVFLAGQKETRAHLAQQDLRSAFGVDEASPLHSRDQRNSLEHSDERLNAYLRSGIVGVILPEYVGMRPVDRSMPYHLFRAYYYLDNGTFSLLGEGIECLHFVDEVLRIHNRVVDWIRLAADSETSVAPKLPALLLIRLATAATDDRSLDVAVRPHCTPIGGSAV